MLACDYDMIVLGGGAAGLTMSAIAARLGARTLLVERHRLGGDCTWTGCIPSKSLIHAARSHRRDFAAVMEALRAVRQRIYEDADAPGVYERMGVHVQFGSAQFASRRAVLISDGVHSTQVTGRYCTIATGAAPRLPPIEGLAALPYYTTETIFEITALPRRLGIIGGGYAGIELGQAFARLGSTVTIWERAPQILPAEDPELVQQLRTQLQKEGLKIRVGSPVLRATRSGPLIAVHTDDDSREVDVLLVATGRRPATDKLNLAAAGVGHSAQGVFINSRCRTSTSRIYAVGDVTGLPQFTHAGEHMAKVAAANALLKLPLRVHADAFPRVLFADPELARVGLTEAVLRRRNIPYRTYQFPFSRLDRAIVDGREQGQIKIFASRRRGKILGAAILGYAAGELICEFALALRQGLTLRQISDTIHPYPTYGLGVRRAADQWYVQHFPARLMRAWSCLRRFQGHVRRSEPGEIL